MSCGSCETSWPRQKVAVSKLSATSFTLSSARSTCRVPVSSSICVRRALCPVPSGLRLRTRYAFRSSGRVSAWNKSSHLLACRLDVLPIVPRLALLVAGPTLLR